MELELESNKIICASWIGRFGNRCHSYLYGKHIEQSFGHKFYIARPWEGCVLFKNPAPVIKNEFSQLRFEYAGGAEKLPSFKKNQNLIDEYNSRNNDSIRLIDPVHRKNYGVGNSAYISLVTDCNWFYENRVVGY